MAITIGQQLGSYEITALLGKSVARLRVPVTIVPGGLSDDQLTHVT